MNHRFLYPDNRFIRQIFLLGILLLILVPPTLAASAGFGPPKVIVGLTTRTVQVKFHLADINADGRKDIVAAYMYGFGTRSDYALLSWFENDGRASPSFMEHNIDELNGDIGLYGWIASADMDRDGRLDIVAMRYGYLHDGWDINEIAIFKNRGGPQPTFQYYYAIEEDYIHYPGFLADLNNDGYIDIVISTNYSLVLYKNNGDWPPHFTHSVLFGYDGYSPYVNLVDLNGDGNIDCLSARGNAMAMRWDENNGAASPAFTRHDINQGTSGPLTVADLNGDGRMDILAGGRFYLNNGGRPATFRLPITFGLPGKTATGDLSGTGNTEVVSSTGHWYSNPGGSSPSLTTHTLTMPAGVKSFDDLAVGDVTGDGNPDIVASAGNKIYLYANQLPARAVRVLSPEGGERLVGGRDPLVVHWKTDVATAGTAVNLELWEGMHKVTNLKYASNPTGEQTEILTFPDIMHTGWYRIRAVASPAIYAFNPNPFMLILPNNINSGKWIDYK